ncbi:MAG: NosD domain-containing protein [Candidatus Heimdallarchaeaceae archaeon]
MIKQSKQYKVSTRTFLCVSILILGIIAFSNMRVNSETDSYNQQSNLSLTPHASISITSDAGLEIFPGSGTKEVPYLIEGYNITTTDTYGISITGTTKYFTVRNCYVDANTYGIYSDNIATGTATVINNTCNNNNLAGIDLGHSDNSIVSNNTCINNWAGIWLFHSGSSTVANNTCNNNYVGNILTSSSHSTIANNTCSDNNIGLSLSYTGSCTVVNNTFTNCGLVIDEDSIINYLSNTVENNLVNGKILGYYINLDSIIISESVYGQLILANCTNVTVSDQILNETSIGLFLHSCTNSNIINNTCNSNNRYGIFLSSSDNSTFVNNTCSNTQWDGIHLYYSDNSTMTNNTCSNNEYGIGLRESINSIVNNNTCNNNHIDGVVFSSSDNSTVANNSCSYNGRYGITFYHSSNSTVSNNTCNNNNEYGIWLESSDYCVITYNVLKENVGYGVYLMTNSDHTPIHHNTFVNNNLGGTSQAYDNCTNNYWYDTIAIEGNYWSDWSGTGSYAIDGSVGSEDLYPLDEPIVDVEAPLIVDIVHSPSIPTELDTIRIDATVTDSSGMQSVTLYYRINGGTWIDVSMNLISGSNYSVTIGPFAISDIIEFNIIAVDSSIHHNEATENNGGIFYIIDIGSSEITAPSITDIVHSPSIPTELDTISINATVTDASGVQSVTLHYRINGGTWQVEDMTLMSGDLYSVTIGPFADNDIIEYYIIAVDNSINNNIAINNNSGLYYSFTITVVVPELQMFSLLFPAITFLFLIFSLVVLQQKKRD